MIDRFAYAGAYLFVTSPNGYIPEHEAGDPDGEDMKIDLANAPSWTHQKDATGARAEYWVPSEPGEWGHVAHVTATDFSCDDLGPQDIAIATLTEHAAVDIAAMKAAGCTVKICHGLVVWFN